MNDREYKINIDPRILELLGPSLYTNIYYILAELIANAYDANAKNVYIIREEDSITVEDDGDGMSYQQGDVEKYLHVAVETRTDSASSLTSDGKRQKMGRKGIGKLAALSVSDAVKIMTKKNNEKSGFILSSHVEADHLLTPIEDNFIVFKKVGDKPNGTSVVMPNPQYKLHKTQGAVKKNLAKIFPIVSKDFKIHLISAEGEEVIDSFDKELIEGLGALITLGEEYENLVDYFDPSLDGADFSKLYRHDKPYTVELELENKLGSIDKHNLVLKGWIGAYRTTRDRKKNINDFPDNFISLFSKGKLGEYNILPQVGKNRLPEVYVVGQLHIELFEDTKLVDMALSNRQGYKSDDPRHIVVIEYVRDTLLPQIITMREEWAKHKSSLAKRVEIENQKKDEIELRQKVDVYTSETSSEMLKLIATNEINDPDKVGQILNKVLPLIGIKQKVDSQKKRILITHSSKDKMLSDVIHKMLSFNSVPDTDIIYTSSENADCRIPEGSDVTDYLREFFVDSYSTEKIFVIYVTSEIMDRTWFAVTEVGAGWITKSDHKIFNLSPYTPKTPLDVGKEWQTSSMEGETITQTAKEFDKFVIKIMYVVEKLGYTPRNKKKNRTELKRYVSVV